MQYLFNSAGQWIAFRENQYVCNTFGKLIGWTAWNDEDVADRDGNYLGTIYPENRLLHNKSQRNHSKPEVSYYPGFALIPDQPKPVKEVVLPNGAEDVNIQN